MRFQDVSVKSIFSEAIERNQFFQAKKIKETNGFHLSASDKEILNEALHKIENEWALDILLGLGADVNSKDINGKSVFSKAIESNEFMQAKKIKETNGFHLSASDKEILNEALHKIENEWALDTLLRLGADVNSKDINGKSIFSKAISFGNFKQARKIKKAEGVHLSEEDVKVLNEESYKTQSYWKLDDLLELGADVDAKYPDGKSVFNKVLENHDFWQKVKEIDETLFVKPDKNILNKALHIINIASSEVLYDIKRLSYLGADINFQDEDGKTILMKMIENHSHTYYIKEVVKLGADINIADANGKYPLDVAVEFRYKDVANMLYDLEAKCDSVDKLQDFLGISIAGKILNNVKPYIKYLDAEMSIEDFSNDKVIKLYKEVNLKSLYFRVKDLQFNNEFSKFIQGATDSGLKEIIIFYDKNSSNIDSDDFNQFLLESNVRINLRIASLTEKDLKIIKQDEFGKRDILAIKDTRNNAFTYRNGHSINLLNDAQSDHIIMKNYESHRKQSIKGITEEYIPNYKYEEVDEINKNRDYFADFEMSINREQEVSAEHELSAEKEASSESQLSIDNEQRDKKFERYKAHYRAIEIHANYFDDSYLMDGNISYMDDGAIMSIFRSSDQIKYITEKALNIISKKSKYFRNGINVKNMPIGLALEDGIIFASNKRLPSMPVNEFTLKLDSIAPIVEQPVLKTGNSM